PLPAVEGAGVNLGTVEFPKPAAVESFSAGNVFEEGKERESLKRTKEKVPVLGDQMLLGKEVQSESRSSITNSSNGGGAMGGGGGGGSSGRFQFGVGYTREFDSLPPTTPILPSDSVGSTIGSKSAPAPELSSDIDKRQKAERSANGK